jgi:hypothetical protein
VIAICLWLFGEDASVERIISRRPLSRFIQIDRLVMVLTGAGTRTTPAFYLPHARYTVFVDADPVRAARSFAMLDEHGNGVRDDWQRIPDFIANVPVPLVQHELPAGRYEITLEMAPQSSCWSVQVVLNSMLSWEAPPKAWRPAHPPPQPITLRRGEPSEFRIARTGHYAFDLSIGGFDGQGGTFPAGFCPFDLRLRADDGHRLHLGEGVENRVSLPSDNTFLGAGRWMVEMETSCEWELTIKPRVGPAGGGARWF